MREAELISIENRIKKLEDELFENTGASLEKFQHLFDEVRALRVRLRILKQNRKYKRSKT